MGKEAMRNMNRAWIHLWFLFLKSNRDYAAYCKARRKKQRSDYTKLEKQFQKIAQVYADFGTVYGVKFERWHKTHKHLFYTTSTPKVTALHNSPKELDPSSAYIQVPFSLPVSKATKQAADVIRAAYKDATDEQKHSPLAKYTLATKVPSYISWLSTMKCYAAWGFTLQNIDGKKLNQKERVEKMINLAESYRDEYWEWSTERLERKSVTYDDIRRSVNKNKKHAEYIIANTIHGVFPVKKPVNK